MELQAPEKILVNFNVIDYNSGKAIYDHVEISVPQHVFADVFTEQAKFDRIDEYINQMDKRDLMYERNWGSIIDWDYQINEDTIKSVFVMLYGDNENMLNHIDVAYSYMKKSIENLSPRQQIDIIHSATKLAFAGINETLTRLSYGNDEPKEHKEIDD